MPPPPQIARALHNEYPKPAIDQEWLEQCCAWVEEDQSLSPTADFQAFYNTVKQQLLKSNLADSMQAGTGLRNIEKFSGNLTGPPVLVQIKQITDIGVSAFQLEQVRSAREERFLAGDGEEEGEEEGDIEVEGEGPMPKFPRGTLHFELSDGQVVLEGMEYRPLHELSLGKTQLGFKLLLRGTRFSNGMAFLEPATVTLLGGYSAEIDAYGPALLKRSLLERLGRPHEDDDTAPVQPPVYEGRAPLRDISPAAPTRYDDDVDMEPRRRVPANSSLNQPSSEQDAQDRRPTKPLPTRPPRNSIEVSINTSNRQSMSSHFNNASSSSNLDFTVPPTTRQVPLNNPLPGPPRLSDGNDSFDLSLLDQAENDENVPPTSVDKGKKRANAEELQTDTADAVSDYGMDDAFFDADILEHIDRIEKAALEKEAKSGPSSSTGKSRQKPESKISSPKLSDDVIEIDGSEDEDKENSFVPMRHVRQRTEDKNVVNTPRGRSPPASQRLTRSQSRKKRTIPIVNPQDVIDISDSD